MGQSTVCLGEGTQTLRKQCGPAVVGWHVHKYQLVLSLGCGPKPPSLLVPGLVVLLADGRGSRGPR